MTQAGTKSAATKTLENLQAAYNGESNARATYLAFSQRADEEGYFAVGSLFRAAARAEEIHAANHAEVIRKLGAAPECKIEVPAVGTTAENLQKAIAGEEHERDVMYPEFIKVAETEGAAAAIRTFKWALDAEAVHAELYSAALKALEQQKVAVDYYVCLICGFTTSDGDFARCVICNNPKEKFEVVK